MVLRFGVLIGCIVLAFSFVVFHLYQVQLVKGGYYEARAASQYLASSAVTANRGLIYFTDKNGNVLPAAINRDFPVIYAVPSAIEDASEAANTLAPILGMPVGDLKTQFSKKTSAYDLLVRRADPSLAAEIENLNMKGIYVDSEPGRFYPLGTIASQVIGFTGPSADSFGETGHYGVEEFYNGALSGISATETDVTALALASDGNLALTIDPNIQTEAEKILADLIKASGATGGSVIVEDPQTGKVLAMGASPDFDPNEYASSSFSDFLNSNVQSVYEPGSIFKVLTMAAGIDAGKITPNTTYDDKGYVDVNRAHITNYDLTTHGPYGSGTTMTQVIEHSINSGAIFAENQIGNAIFTSYMKKFRLDQKTGIDLPGEVAGNLSQLNPKSPQVDFDTVAYGQGVAVTPVELVSAVGAIANGGTIMRPYVDAALAPQAMGRVISAST
ncbi:MAG TPA: penicillin-binding protein 2, partial [Candidatus Paceibacterota bacterium]|nr:penicillin-binding protein 2 [Candidatus Paceibacterota bacterium]